MMDVTSPGVVALRGVILEIYNATPSTLEDSCNAHKNIVIEDTCGHMLRGSDLEGRPLKPNKAKTRANKGHGKPLIDTGQMSNKKNWDVGIKLSRSSISLSPTPTGTRRVGVVTIKEAIKKLRSQGYRKNRETGEMVLRDSTIWFVFLPKKGYDKSQGWSEKAIEKTLAAITADTEAMMQAALQRGGFAA